MSLADYRKKFPEYDKVSDKKLVGALYQKYGEGMDHEDFAVKIKAPLVRNPDMTEHEQQQSDSPKKKAISNYIADRYTPEQIFEDNMGYTYTGQKSEPGHGLVADEETKSLQQSQRYQAQLEKQAGTSKTDEAFKSGDRAFKDFYEGAAYKDFGKVYEEDTIRPGQIYEGGKDVARGVSTGTLTLALSTRDKEYLEKSERMFRETGLDRMTGTERQRFGEAVTRGQELKGSPLTEQEQSNLRVQTLLKNDDDHNKIVFSAISAVQNKLAKDPEYINSHGFWEDVLRMGPQVGGQMLVALATGGAGSIAFMGVHIAGSTYEDQTAQGVDPRRAIMAGYANAIMQAPLEYIGISKAMKMFKLKGAVAERFKALGSTMGTEWLTEFLQAHPETLTDIWGKGANKSNLEMLAEYQKRFYKTLTDGAYEGFVASVIPGAGGVVKIGTTVVRPTPIKIKHDYIGDPGKDIKEMIDAREDITPEEKEAAKVEVDSATEILDPVDIDEMMAVEQKKQEQSQQSETDRAKLTDLAKVNRKLTVNTIKQLQDSKSIESIIKTYETMDDASMNRNDKARQKAAIVRKSQLDKFDTDSKAFTESMKPKPVQAQKIVEQTKKKQLSPADKKLLADRKKERGGITAQQMLSNEAMMKKETPVQEFAPEVGMQKEVPPIPGTTLKKPSVGKSQKEITLAPAIDKPNIFKPVGQRPVKGSPHIGSVFSRDDEYVEQGNRSDLLKEVAITSRDEEILGVEVGLSIIEDLEKDIYEGTYEGQELLNELIDTGAEIEFFVADLTKRFGEPNTNTRGVTVPVRRSIRTGLIDKIRIGLNPKILGHDADTEFSRATFIHEMIHGLFRTKTGATDSAQAQRMYKEIQDIWYSIPIEELRRFQGWATEAKHQGTAQWKSYTNEQQNFRIAWANLLDNLGRTANLNLSNADRMIYWEEVMANAFSRTEIMQKLAQIKSKNPKTQKVENIWTRLMRALLKGLLPETKYQSIGDDLVDIATKYAQGFSIESQLNASEPISMQAQRDLQIQNNPKFPKGSTKLQAALIDAETNRVWVSPLGHWDIQGAPSGCLDGFAAVDKHGAVLDYYTRDEAGRLVDPNVEVIDPDGKALTSEDLYQFTPQFEKDFTTTLVEASNQQKKARKRLSEVDRALLKSRLEARGGLTPAQVWAKTRSDNQKLRDRYLKDFGVESRWDKLDPAKDLATMKPDTLEKEAGRVRAGIKAGQTKGLTRFQGQLRYYEQRLSDITALQEKRIRDDLVIQKAAEEKLASNAGNTTRQNTKFFKAEYKRLVKRDAPHSAVQFAKNQLVDLMGPVEFYGWSGEEAPAFLKDVASEPMLTGPVQVTKVPEFTEEDAKTFMHGGIAKDAGEARRKLTSQMDHIRTKYIATGEILSKEDAGNVYTSLNQARNYDIIDDTEMQELSDEILVAMSGGQSSYENTIHRENIDAKHPIQKIFDKYSPRTVIFDAYYSPSDGFVPSGYSFTITDRDSPAYAASIVTDSITKEAIQARIKEAEKLFTKKANREYQITMDGQGVTKARSDFGKDSRILIEFDHRAITPYSKENETTISFILEEKGQTPTYERYEFSRGGIKDKPKKAIQTIKMIQRMLFNLLNNNFKAPVPHIIKFTGSTYDEKKNTIYKGFAKRLADKLGWKLKVQRPLDDEPQFLIINPVKNTEDAFEQELNSDDAPPYDGLVQFETQETELRPFKFEDPQMQKDADKGEKGYQSPGVIKKFVAFVHENGAKYFREFAELPRKVHAATQFKLRQLKKGQGLSTKQAAKMLAKNLDSLSKAEFKDLTKLSYMMDLYEQVRINKELRAAGKDVIHKEFPYGWSEQVIEKETKRLWEHAQKNSKVMRAWNNRLEMWRDLRTTYVNSMSRHGFDVASRLQRAFYFRHQVLDILKAQHEKYGLSGTGGKLAVPTRRSHLRKRKGGGYEMNLNYIQAEFEIMSQMIYDTQIADTLADILDKHGKNKEDIPENTKEKYVLFEPREDSVFFMVNSVPGQIVKNGIVAGLKDINVPMNKVKPVLALGGKYKGYFLPENLATTLNEALLKPRSGPVWRFMRNSLRAWKMWQLLSPFRFLKYNTRNMTGDAEAMFVGDMATFKYVGVSAKELWAWKTKGVISEDLQDWFDRGGSETTLQSQEMGHMLTDPYFRKELVDRKTTPLTPLKWIGTKARNTSDVREAFLRFAAYKRYVKLLNSGKKIKNYAASMPEEVNALDSNEDKAFMMSNDLLGAYDRISVSGNFLRDYIAPFWSFQEINMKRTVQFVRNAVKNDDLMMSIGRKLGAKGIMAPLKLGKLAFKFTALQTVCQFWNAWMWPDDEDALPDEMHRRVHIIFGSGKDDILYFPRIGILGDLLEWAGVDTVPSDVSDLITGMKTWDQVVESYNYGAENLKDVANKAVQSLGPQFKIPMESIGGKKLFPSMWSQQPITDYSQYVAEQLQMRPFYDAIAGKPTKESHWTDLAVQMSPIYKGDRNRFGWLAIQQKVHDYKKKAGLSGSGFIVTESGKALYNMGVAYRYGDVKAVRKYLREFLVIKTEQWSKKIDLKNTIENQWEKLDPRNQFTDKRHEAMFLAGLNKRDQYAYGLAIMYYNEIKSGKQFYKFIEENQ